MLRLVKGEYPTMTITLVVSSVRGLRQREYSDGTIFDVVGHIPRGDRNVAVLFHDSWASAASFMVPSDEITLMGFEVIPNPVSGVLLVIPRKGLETRLTVAHTEENGDVIEVRVNPANFDNPTARLRCGRPSVSVLSHDSKV